MSLWDFSRRFTTAARLVAVPAPAMADELVNYTELGAWVCPQSVAGNGKQPC